MKCQSCGAPLDTSSTDLVCPACLLREALNTSSPVKEADTAALAGQAALPREFGPYELIEELGRGGMGVVYRARQPALSRVVAVKLLLAGAYASEAALRRFQLEAAAAAALQHPHIVAIHDYGEVDGQPYYAMDLVPGRTLADLCAGRPLPATRAAEYLRMLAGAVHYAHLRGILHRDLKPSNVLIDDAGRPRITDFGLVKFLGSPEGATLPGQMLGSPSYAAPEQAAGRFAAISVASDIYGLGALFYHLVTGRAPFNAATPTETLRLVLDTDPPAPRLLNPSLPRDLETICLKCLSKDPSHRYASASEVADDVARFLDQRPIRARPPRWLYRLMKFARRHRIGVSATAAVILALAAGLGFALVGFRRAVVQRGIADAARVQAEQLVGLMTQKLTPAFEARGGLPQLVQMAEATVEYYATLPANLRRPKTDRGHANALAALARLRGISLDDRKGAATALDAALVLRRRIAEESPDDPEAAADLLWDEWERPLVTGDNVAYRSEIRQEKAVRVWQALHARFPENIRIIQGRAEVLAFYAQNAAFLFDKPKEAVATATECRSLVEQLAKACPQDERLGALTETSLRALSTALAQVGETDQAIRVSEQALAYCTARLRAEPGNVKLREQAAEAARNLSYRAGGNLAKARDAERIAREHYRVLIELAPENQEYRFRFALTHMMECYFLLNLDTDIAATRKAFLDFHALLKPFIGRKGYDASFETWTFDCYYLAILAAWSGDPTESRKEIDQAHLRLADWSSRIPAESFERSINRTRSLCMESWVLSWLRDWKAMQSVAQDCLSEIEVGLKKKPADPELLLRQAVANSQRGIAKLHDGQPAQALRLLPPAIAIMHAAPRVNRVYELRAHLGSAQMALVEAFAQAGDREKARQAVQQLLPGTVIFRTTRWADLEWYARVLTLAASLCESEELPRCMMLTDRAERILTGPSAQGRLTVGGREDLATIAQLRAASAARLELESLATAGRQLDEAAAENPEIIDRLTKAGEVVWDFGASFSLVPHACQVELSARDGYRQLMAQHPDNQGYRFLFAATHRMECYLHFDCDGQVEPARAAFRHYDALLEPFVGRQGYASVLRTRLFNSIYLSQLAASVGDKADADAWSQRARERFVQHRESLAKNGADRQFAQLRFMQDAAWGVWWLRDWPGLARQAQEMLTECDPLLTAQPANGELLCRRAMAEGFAALAFAGTSPHAGAATRLTAARNALREALGLPASNVRGALTELWLIEDAMVDALQKSGNIAQAQKWTEEFLASFEWVWGADGPGEYWRGQKHLATVRLQAAAALDPALPIEDARRKELLDRVAATLASDKVAGRLTTDVQEMMRELARLRAASSTATE